MKYAIFTRDGRSWASAKDFHGLYDFHGEDHQEKAEKFAETHVECYCSDEAEDEGEEIFDFECQCESWAVLVADDIVKYDDVAEEYLTNRQVWESFIQKAHNKVLSVESQIERKMRLLEETQVELEKLKVELEASLNALDLAIETMEEENV